MSRLLPAIACVLLVALAACNPLPVGQGGERGQPADVLAPMPTATAPSGPGAPLVAILSPLHIDASGGRLFAVAQVNGISKVVTLAGNDGRLLAAWDDPGQLALDAARNRLVVDRGPAGIALLDATTGATQGTVELPAQDAPPPPQIDAATGTIYAFRGTTIYTIDPATGEVIRTQPISVTRLVCDTPSGEADIQQSAYDPAARRLYLTYLSRTCIPWAGVTIVAVDAAEMTEIGRRDADITHQFLPYDGHLYGVTVSRLGPTTFWAWDGAQTWYEESADFQGGPAGMAVDTERELIYEAIGGAIRVIDPNDRALISQAAMPVPADARLAGHDPQSDLLYFVTTTGRLILWPAANLFGEAAVAVAAPSPLPAQPVRALAVSPATAAGHTTAAILEQADCPSGGQLFLMTDPGGWFSGGVGTAPCAAVAAVAFSPDYQHDALLFAAVNEPPAILRTVDTGRSWTPALTAFDAGTRFDSLLVSLNYANDQTLFALTSAGLLYRSRDGGREWRLLDQRLDRVALTQATDTTVNLFGTLNGRLLHSADGGETWAETGMTPNSEQLTLLAAAPADTPILFAFTAGGRFLRSLDGGATWNPVIETSPAPVQLAIAAGPPEQRPMFLLHDRSIQASYDGMASIWAATAADEAGRFHPTALALPPDFAATPYLYVGTEDGQVVRVRADATP